MAKPRLSKTTRSLLKLLLSAALSVYVIAVVAMPRSAPDYREAASKHFAAREYAAALRDIELAMENSPGEFSDPESRKAQADLLHERGECNMHVGRPDHAIQDFREARTLEPSNYRRWLKEGEAFLTAERFRDAALLYQEAAVAFPDREQSFRYAAGCAYYQQSQADSEVALKELKTFVSPALQPEFALELRGVVAGRRSATEVHHEFLPPPYDGPERRRDWQQVESARQSFASAAQLLDDYLTFADIEPASGLVRLRMDYDAGQPYTMRLLAETLLRLDPPDADSLKVRELLANALYDLGAYQAAANFFLSMRRELQRDKNFLEGRRVTFFAVDALLHENRGAEALQEMDAQNILSEGKILNLYYLGRAQFLVEDRAHAIPTLKKAVDALKEVDFTRGGWFRSKAHQHWILEGLTDSLVSAGEREYALEVVSAAADLYPDEPAWVRHRAALLRELGRSGDELAADSLAVLRSGVRRTEDFENWMQDNRALPESQDLASQVALQSDRILRSYAVNREEREDGLQRIKASEILERQQNRDVAGRTRASALLADLHERYFLGVSVWEDLRRQRHEEQAYLLMLGLEDAEPDVLQFPFLLARQDLAQGRLEDAVAGFRRVLAGDPTDVESAVDVWLLLRRRGDRPAMRSLEADLLDRDPEGTGRVLAALGALEDGFADIALSTGQSGDPAAAGGLARGVASLALWTKGDPDAAKTQAAAALEVNPGDLFAQNTMILLLDQESPDSAAEYVVTHEDQLRAMPPEYLANLGRALMEASAFAQADRVLRLALDQDPTHQVARLDLVDTLIALNRFVEALNHLGQLPATATTVQRRALVELLQNGPEAAYEFLRTRMASSTRGESLDVWLALLGTTANRLESTFALPLPEALLTDDETRFLALQLLLGPPSSAETPGIPNRVRARVSEFRGMKPGTTAEARRDRRLELWLSLELLDPTQRDFSGEFLPLLLLARTAGAEPLQASLEARVLEHFPKLSELARDRARRLADRGHRKEAAISITRAVLLDPGDPENIAALVAWSHELTHKQLEALKQPLSMRPGDDGVRLLVEGLLEKDADRAVEKLTRAQESLKPPGPAVAARLRVEQRRLALEGVRPFETSPYSELGALNEDRARRRQFVALMDEALTANPGDATVLDFVAEALRDAESTVVTPEITDRLVRSLAQRPQPLWNVYRTAARLVQDQDLGEASFEDLSVSLRQALSQNPEAPRDLALEQCLMTLVRGLRGHADPAVVRSFLEQAEDICPYATDVLAEKASIAEEQGDYAGAEKLRWRALACGDSSPDILAWLAEYTFLERASIDAAGDLVEQAARALGPSPSPELLIRVTRTRARVDYIRGRSESANAAFESSLRVANLDPEDSPDYALQLFASGSDQALDVVGHLAEQEGPRQQQMQRFLAVLKKPQEPAEEGGRSGQRGRSRRNGEAAGEAGGRAGRNPISVPEARAQRRPSEEEPSDEAAPVETQEQAPAGNEQATPPEEGGEESAEPSAPRAPRRQAEPGSQPPNASRERQRPQRNPPQGDGKPERAPRKKPQRPPPGGKPDGGG